MKKLSWKIAVVALAASLLISSCGNQAADEGKKDDKIVVGLSLMLFNHPFMQDVLAGAYSVADQLGVEVKAVDPNLDVTTQLQSLEDIISTGELDALFINAIDANAIIPIIDDANNLNIPVVSVDTRPAGGKMYAHVASDNYEIGVMAGKQVAKLLKERNGSVSGTIIEITAPQNSAMNERCAGFAKALEEYPEVKIIQKTVANLATEAAQAMMDDVIQAYPPGSIDLVFPANNTTGIGALAATEAANRKDYIIFAVDDDEAFMAALESGGVFKGMIVQDGIDIGKQGMTMAIKAAKGETPDKTEIATNIILVTSENYKQHAADYKRRQEEVSKYYTISR
jgi:ribose transport system substrate-binding protein